MQGNEVTDVDQRIRAMLQVLDLDSPLWEQGAGSPELQHALKGGAKSANPKSSGKPEFVFLSGGHLVIIEDKYGAENLVATDGAGEVVLEHPQRAEYASNGALHYAKHIVSKSPQFNSIFAVGAAGDSVHIETQVFHVDRERVKELPATENFAEFDASRIEEYYRVAVLGELPKEERDIRELRKVANRLHEDLRNYAAVSADQKAPVISAILLALQDPDFSIDHLRGETTGERTDGWKIWKAAKAYLDQAYVDDDSGYAKRGSVQDELVFIRGSEALNRVQPQLGGITPLKKFALTLKSEVLDHLRNSTSNFDVLGSFYGEVVRYGNSDGADLGIVLTPHHVTSLMADLVEVNRHDYVIDPCAGTGSFLVAAMNRMIGQANGDEQAIDHIKSDRLHGIELQPKLHAVGVTNMIMRGDGKAHFHFGDMFHLEPESLGRSVIKQPNGSTAEIQHGFTKCLMNPPFSQSKNKQTANLSELHFIEQALSMLNVGAKLAAIVPISAVTRKGNSRLQRTLKARLLKTHTLESVITLNPQTFHPVGTHAAIVVFTAHQPHPKDRRVSFVNFKDDGMGVRPHIGLVNDGTHSTKREYLLKVLAGDVEESTRYIVRATVKPDDEWIHSFHYFEDSPPSIDDFEQTVADYLTFQMSMVAHGRGYLFENVEPRSDEPVSSADLQDRDWEEFSLDGIAEIITNKRLERSKLRPGDTPYIASSAENNGVTSFTSNTHSSTHERVLGVNYNGSVGKTFYHPYQAVFTDDVKTVRLRDRDAEDHHALLFLATCIEHQRHKYGYGYKFNGHRMARQRILLPVTAEGDPDWQFMSSYGRRVETKVTGRLWGHIRNLVES